MRPIPAGLLALVLSVPPAAAGPVEFKDCGPCGPACGCQLGRCPDGCPAADRSAVKVNQQNRGGSGVVVASGGGKSLVLTNRHVCPVLGPATVEAGGKRYPAECVRRSDYCDLAALEVDGRLPAAPLAAADPAAGARLRMWGFPAANGCRKTPKSGPALGYDGSWNAGYGGLVYHVGFVSESGDSGAGLFDAAGRLCAVMWGTDHRVGSCVGLADIRRFVADVRGERTEKGPKKAAPAAPAAPAPLAYADAHATALKEAKPLVVFVACPNVRPIPGAVVTTGLEHVPFPPGTGIVIGKPLDGGALKIIATLKGCASDAAIAGHLKAAPRHRH